jgi:hypothetical protein
VAVCGLIPGFTCHKFIDVDLVLKELVHAMKSEPRPFIGVTRMGRMPPDEAKERAKRDGCARNMAGDRNFRG